MKKYQQLSHEERVKIAQLYQLEWGGTEIGKAVGRNKSTISRELKRNQAPPGEYWPDTAQKLAQDRRKRRCVLDKNEELRNFVLDKLRHLGWSPEQMAGHLKHRQKELASCSHETIYAWIYGSSQKREKLWKYLPRYKAKRGLRKSKGAGVDLIPNRISISQRPKAVKNKKCFGNWEGDLMSFPKNTQHILVVRERTSMFIFSKVLETKKADATGDIMVDVFKDLPKNARKTITFDNGGEFARHTQLNEKLGMLTFFCDPYASWQKGGVENTNGRLRRDLPRKTNVKSMKKEDFDESIENYNRMPPKSLGWFTPAEVVYKNLHRVALQS